MQLEWVGSAQPEPNPMFGWTWANIFSTCVEFRLRFFNSNSIGLCSGQGSNNLSLIQIRFNVIIMFIMFIILYNNFFFSILKIKYQIIIISYVFFIFLWKIYKFIYIFYCYLKILSYLLFNFFVNIYIYIYMFLKKTIIDGFWIIQPTQPDQLE